MHFFVQQRQKEAAQHAQIICSALCMRRVDKGVQHGEDALARLHAIIEVLH